MDDKIRDAIESKKGFAVIVAGSDSDMPHIEKLSEALLSFEIPHQVRICSAHKQPEKLREMVAQYDALDGSLAYIAVAGGCDALSGTLSCLSVHPVISCPPGEFNGSVVSNPPGSSNAYIPHPKNAARFVAQIFSHSNKRVYVVLYEGIEEKVRSLERADEEHQAYRGNE